MQPRCTLRRLIAIRSYLLGLSANSLFICLVNLFEFISLTQNSDQVIILYVSQSTSYIRFFGIESFVY